MGLCLGGLIIGRIFASEIWGACFRRAFFLGGGEGLLSEFYGINANNNVNFTCHVNSLFSVSQFLFGGGGHSTKFFMGRLRPKVQTLTFLYTIFDSEGTPFIYLS